MPARKDGITVRKDVKYHEIKRISISGESVREGKAMLAAFPFPLPGGISEIVADLPSDGSDLLLVVYREVRPPVGIPIDRSVP